MEGQIPYPATFDVSGQDSAVYQADTSSKTAGRSYLQRSKVQQWESLEEESDFEFWLIKTVCEWDLHERYVIPRSRIRFKKKKRKEKKKKNYASEDLKTIKKR
ncbi:hypothetical protein GB937_008686 [Aspergillus fischeri]|nr:hypothetical protein GB937_008686 [Aspergillus fischeri]